MILDGIEEFREHLGGELTVTLLRGIGRGEEVHSLDGGADPARHGVAAAPGNRPMRLGSSHLTYCTNIHPGETWAEVRANLERYLPRVKRRVCPDAPFGVGLRLSAEAAQSLTAPEHAGPVRRLSARERSLRLHHQRLSLRRRSTASG